MKKNKLAMSIILVSVLLVLCIFSFTNKQIYSFFGIENLKSDIVSLTSDNINNATNATNTNSSSESATRISDSSDDTTKNNNPLNIYKTIIPEYKIKSMDELVQVSLEKSTHLNLTFTVKSAKATKNCPGYTLDNDILKKFSNEVMDNKGNLLSGYYYLDVKISVTNTGSNSTSYTLNSLKYITITGEKHEAFYRNFYYDEGAGSEVTPYYWQETDGKSLIPIMKFIMHFEPGETCEYRACYIVPEEYNTNELYLFYSSGTRSIEDANQRFIKLDIQ